MFGFLKSRNWLQQLVVVFAIALPCQHECTLHLIILLWLLQVSKIQVASVVAAALSNTTVSENKVIFIRLFKCGIILNP